MFQVYSPVSMASSDSNFVTKHKGDFREWWGQAKRKGRRTVNVKAPLLRRDAAFRNGTGDRRRPNVASDRDQIPSEPVEQGAFGRLLARQVECPKCN